MRLRNFFENQLIAHSILLSHAKKLLIQFEHFWSKSDKFEPIWSILIQITQVWANLIKSDPNQTNLNQFNQVWSKSDKFEPIWTSLIQVGLNLRKIVVVAELVLNSTLLPLRLQQPDGNRGSYLWALPPPGDGRKGRLLAPGRVEHGSKPFISRTQFIDTRYTIILHKYVFG